MTENPLLNLPWRSLLPLRGVVVTLRLLRPATFQFYHQPALTAFIRTLLGGSDGYENQLCCDAVESGVTQFRSGDHYRFAVVALAGQTELLDRLLDQLRQLPFSASDVGRDAPLKNNVTLANLTDLWGRRTPVRAADLNTYGEREWLQEVSVWQICPEIHLRWLSPVRLMRAKEERERLELKGEGRFCRERADLAAPLLYQRLHDTLAELLRRLGVQHMVRPDHLLPELTDVDLYWVDAHYRDRHGKRNGMGGLLGRGLLGAGAAIALPLLSQWVLAQYLGMGQRRAFGWGRFRLESAAGDTLYPRPARGVSILERVADEENLRSAWQVIEQNRRQNRPSAPEGGGEGLVDEDPLDEEWGDEGLWYDDEESAPDHEPPLARLRRIGAELATGRYHAPPMTGVIHHDRDGDLRALAIPPFFDRVAQRSVNQILNPGLDQLMYEGSFGFRPGRSRQQARDAIQRAWREGYRWVYESDISDFFDSVQWQRVRARIDSLYDDEQLTAQILAWIAAPVLYQGELIERRCGLPQGSPISPLLANLILDDFDADLALAGFRLIRFADDFVVLCKDRDQAEQAAGVVDQSLAELGLSTHPDKTRILHIDEGFRYLGYLFVGELTLDAAGEEGSDGQVAKPSPPSGWLARLGRRLPQPMSEATLPATPAEGRAPAWQPPTSPSPAESGTVVVVSGEPSQLSSRNHHLRVSRDGKTVHSLPWRQIQSVLLLGPHHITTPALRHAMGEGIAVHFADTMGRYQGSAAAAEPAAAGLPLWQRQLERWQPESPANLEAARALVESRIQSQMELLRQLHPAADRAVIEALERQLQQLPTADSARQLNGHEGSAARILFEQLASRIDDEYGFSHRTRNPPRDPVNALLSLGYTLLYTRTDSLLRASGLLPWCGFYHHTHGRHAALASDLMEPFRYLVERTVLQQVTHRKLAPADFEPQPDGSVFCRRQARKQFLQAVTDRLSRPVKGRNSDRAGSFEQNMLEQIGNYSAWLRGELPRFRPWRLR